jgi:hypothetical protein
MLPRHADQIRKNERTEPVRELAVSDAIEQCDSGRGGDDIQRRTRETHLRRDGASSTGFKRLIGASLLTTRVMR